MTQSSFVPIHPNPYIVGNPVRDPRMFFGRMKEFEFVATRFQSGERGGLLVFCGERRSGKTSILFQILDGSLGEGFHPVLIDMQAVAMESEAVFLSKISEEIAQSLGSDEEPIPTPDYNATVQPASAFLDFVKEQRVRCPDKKLVLLFDEYELFETKIESGQLSRDILAAFSNLMENHPVYFIFTGSQHLEQRNKKYWEILGKSLYRRVSYLHVSDAIRLITEPLGDEIQYLDDTVERIYRLSGGQPFYTQAVCQNIVDLLNELQTRQVTTEIVESVVEGMVDNPLPQMIFLWDGLSDNEKLALGLLAEALEDENSHASAEDLVEIIKRNPYPVSSGRTEIATALEELFKEELLSKTKGASPSYSFRMDLWRCWVARMHTVWEVIAEIQPAPVPKPGATRILLPALIALVVAVVAGAWFLQDPPPPPPPPPETEPKMAIYLLSTRPSTASIYHEDELVGTGQFLKELEAEQEHRFKVTAAGYVDSTFVINLSPEEDQRQMIVLPPRTGSLYVETTPNGANIIVNGKLRGKSPILVSRLSVVEPHEVEASLDGYQAQRASYRTVADSTRKVRLPPLPRSTVDVHIETDPAGATVFFDGVQQTRRTPVTMGGVVPGLARIKVLKDNYIPIDTVITVTPLAPDVRLTLTEEPPGILEVRGSRPSQVSIDGVLVTGSFVHNAGRQTLTPGDHVVEVLLRSGDTLTKHITISPGEHVVYDYIRNTVERLPKHEL